MPICSLVHHITDYAMTLEYSYTTLYIMHYVVHHVLGVNRVIHIYV